MGIGFGIEQKNTKNAKKVTLRCPPPLFGFFCLKTI
jgi:hypothetical protein